MDAIFTMPYMAIKYPQLLAEYLGVSFMQNEQVMN